MENNILFNEADLQQIQKIIFVSRKEMIDTIKRSGIRAEKIMEILKNKKFSKEKISPLLPKI